MAGRISGVALLVAASTVACSGSEDTTAATVSATETSVRVSADLATFCEKFTELDVEQTESYVGSPDQLSDIEDLLVRSPDPVRSDVTAFRDYLATGAIDSQEDPESNLIVNWPAEVQAAIAGIQAFGGENC